MLTVVRLIGVTSDRAYDGVSSKLLWHLGKQVHHDLPESNTVADM